MKVLVAEADGDVRKALTDTLEGWGYQIVEARNPADALASFRRDTPPGLVVLGGLGEAEASRKVCRELREFGEKPYVYMLAVSKKGEGQHVLEMMEAGADDFLLVPYDELEFKARLRAGKRILDLREELQRAQATIGYQAYHDPLTGLWNRGAIIDALQRELARVRREKSPVGLLLVSLDGLKEVNDKFGHMAGDAAIRATARELRSSLRPYDALGRYGGETFLMIVTGCDSRSALKQAERFQAALQGKTVDISQWGKFASGKDAQLPLKHCIGVVSGTGDHDSESLLRTLEGAVRTAKSKGGGCVESVTPPPVAAKKK